jgi:hypothetical protein
MWAITPDVADTHNHRQVARVAERGLTDEAPAADED